VQDGTDLNFATHPECDGLGIIGKNGKRASGTLGLHMHPTLAVGTDGIPLGVPRIGSGAPDGKADRGRPEGESRSARWLRGLRDAPEMAGRCPGARCVAVMDRGAGWRSGSNACRPAGRRPARGRGRPGRPGRRRRSCAGGRPGRWKSG